MHDQSDKLSDSYWSVQKLPTVSVTQAGGHIFITEATDPERMLRYVDLERTEEGEENECIDVQVLVINESTGEFERLPRLTCHNDAGQCFSLFGRIHLNCGDRIISWDRSTAAWTTVVASPGHEAQSPIESVGNSIVALWRDPDRGPDTPCFRFSKTTESGTEWGPWFASEGYSATWLACEGDLYVRCSLAGEGTIGAPEPPTVFRLDPRSLEVKSEIAAGRRGSMFIANGQLFCDQNIMFGEVASPTRNFQVPPQLQANILAISGVHPAQSTVLSCYELPTMKLRKRWNIWEDAHSITIAPEGRGILVTHAGTPGTVRLLSSRTPDPMVVGVMNAAVISGPIGCGRRVFWLCHLADQSEYYTLHDWWPNLRSEVETKRPTDVVSWYDEESQKWRRVTPRSKYEPTYLLAALDMGTREWTAWTMELEEPLHSVLANGERLIFVGWSRIWATSVEEFARAAEPFRGPAPDVFGDRTDNRRPIVYGLPLTGPKTDDWAFRSDSPAVRQVFEASHARAVTERIKMDSDLRTKTLDLTVANTIHGVLKTWPDAKRVAKRRCPSDVVEAYTSRFRAVGATPFGKLSTDPELILRIGKWLTTVGKKLRRNDQTEREALLTARFLLHEYIRRCKNNVKLEGEEPVVNPPSTGPYAEWLRWYNLGRRRQGEKWAKTLNATWLEAKMLWATVRGSAVMNEGPERIDIARLIERWPGGCPPLIQDVHGRLGYIRDCVELAKLIAPHHRSSLQAAVARSWENVSAHGAKQAFISYSHSSSRQTEIIAEGLRVRGLRVALDKHELQKDAEEWDVETWIAERILASDVIVYIFSAGFVESGWVNRETEWEHRLYGVKPAVTLPYLVFLDQEPTLRGYPASRIIDARGLVSVEDYDRLLGELALRISYDFLHAVLSNEHPIPYSPFEMASTRSF